jgi:hypothetical protein
MAACLSGIEGIEMRIDRSIVRGRFQSMRVIRKFAFILEVLLNVDWTMLFSMERTLIDM